MFDFDSELFYGFARLSAEKSRQPKTLAPNGLFQNRLVSFCAGLGGLNIGPDDACEVMRPWHALGEEYE